MNKSNTTLAALGLLALLTALVARPAIADDGHGHDSAPVAAGGSALPRFSAVSEAFELVGVVSGTHLTVYLDRFDDNAPVKDANVELELGGAKVALARSAEGEFEGKLAHALQPGVVAVTATVVAGSESDILAGDFVVPAAATAASAEGRGWRSYAAWTAAAAVALAALAWIGRRAAGTRRAGGTA
ncbi:hypothetical protein QTH87_21450 [Variovorax sp. J22P168]|uniref:hypothetical protein n=1 Tax=Variovorax jilinensis TaxID=3053513 RepID=UPI0025757BC0|nr:hypothetical protein [Variovorax sp. J22P168]MDM0015026.1 hypothetical protein [Variovorax sp. J22P168]